MAGAGTERTPDEIAGKHDPQSLFAPVDSRDGELQHAFQNVANQQRFVALPQHGLSALQYLMPTKFVEFIKVTFVQ